MIGQNLGKIVGQLKKGGELRFLGNSLPCEEIIEHIIRRCEGTWSTLSVSG